VLMGDRSLQYDYLVLATGARDSYFGHDEWEPFAPGLKSIPQATDIRRKILLAFEQAETAPDEATRAAMLTFVLVGGGPTGVELAGAIAELAHKALAADFRHIDPRMARIILIEAGPRILSSFSADLSHKSKRALAGLGVEVREGQRVESIDAEGVIVAGARIDCRSVIWSAGVRASPAGEWLGAEVDKAGRVKVQDDLRVPNAPNIFVIGDTMTMQQDGKALPGVAPVAMQQGRYVAQQIVRRVEKEPIGIGPFHYTDKGNMATVGRAFAVMEAGKIKMSGYPAWLAWLVIHVYFLIGFRNRAVVLLQWIWAYLTYQRGARIITVPAPPPNPPPANGSQPNRRRPAPAWKN
ncbi:MAG TPA: NAD(P)/FAD-dependent oxidoreductase, partial [Chthonomonadaceae bacterium]|nr:NAD(P)/FAD-dependent oxidoreductase [Chthonomonadaceae bacterium]